MRDTEDRWTVAETCVKCGEDIYAGNKFVLTASGAALCESCASIMDVEELLEMIGFPMEVAV